MLDKSRPAIELIERLIKEFSVVGFDESGCYVNGKLNWSWIAETTYLTLVFRGAGRGAKVLEDRFGDSLKRMVAVTDRHSAYFAIDFLKNLICLAHLLRNLEYLNDIDREQTMILIRNRRGQRKRRLYYEKPSIFGTRNRPV